MMVSAAVTALLFGTAARAQTAVSPVNPDTPKPDCTMHVNYDRNADLPGYRLGAACIPFTHTYQLMPAGEGRDFYVTGFSNAAIRKRWETCRQDAACHMAALNGAKPFIAYEPRLTGTVDQFGRIDPEGDIDLKSIRRPGYFGAAATEALEHQGRHTVWPELRRSRSGRASNRRLIRLSGSNASPCAAKRQTVATQLSSFLRAG